MWAEISFKLTSDLPGSLFPHFDQRFKTQIPVAEGLSRTVFAGQPQFQGVFQRAVLSQDSLFLLEHSDQRKLKVHLEMITFGDDLRALRRQIADNIDVFYSFVKGMSLKIKSVSVTIATSSGKHLFYGTIAGFWLCWWSSFTKDWIKDVWIAIALLAYAVFLMDANSYAEKIAALMVAVVACTIWCTISALYAKWQGSVKYEEA